MRYAGDPRDALAAILRRGRRNIPAPCRATVAWLAVALALQGCSDLTFYWQGLTGQLDLVTRAKSIPEVAATTADNALKDRLLKAQAIRGFASRELALPDNASYTRYADLGRSYVVWNVVAAPELSLVPRQWCFPVAGCVAYRGYFAEDDARAEAARLAHDGLDVHVSGVPAYSTLGWFDDPVLSTFIRYRETELARLVFHELAHQIVYVKDDTAFNESFAVAVEEEGLARWLAAQRDRPDAAQLAADVARAQRLRAGFRALIRATRDRLAALYASGASEAEKRAGKVAAFAAMRDDYGRMKMGGEPLPGIERWFDAGANNAGIVAAGLYADRVPQFAALLTAEGGDLPRFYSRVKALAATPKAERDAALASLPTAADGAAGERRARGVSTSP